MGNDKMARDVLDEINRGIAKPVSQAGSQVGAGLQIAGQAQGYPSLPASPPVAESRGLNFAESRMWPGTTQNYPRGVSPRDALLAGKTPSAAPPVGKLPPAGPSHTVGGLVPPVTPPAQPERPDLSQFGAGGLQSPVKEPTSLKESDYYTVEGNKMVPKPVEAGAGVVEPERIAADTTGQDTLINQLLNDPKSIHPHSGLLRKSVRDNIIALQGQKAELQRSEMTGKYGVESQKIQTAGTKATAEASKLATRQIADESREERKRTAMESIRVREAELAQRTAAGLETTALRSDIAKERSFQTALTKHGEDPIMGFNAGKGLFEMGFHGIHADRPEVQQAYLPFKVRLEKAFGKTPTAKEKKIAKEAWYKEMEKIGWTP